VLQKYNRWKVLKFFFDNPIPIDAGFQLREISRKVSLATTSVKQYLNEMVDEGLIIQTNHRLFKYPVYRANFDSTEFKLFKKIDTIISLKESGLIEYLENQCMPDVIILFGSASKGEDTMESDIDLFLVSREIKLDIQDFEIKFKRNINLLFSENFGELSNELKNNIINGVILKGYLKVF